MEAIPPDVTALLRRWSSGDVQAREQLVPILYSELPLIARHRGKRGRDGHALQTSASVQEGYLRLCGPDPPHWMNRARFSALAARIGRMVVDQSRRHNAGKSGGGAVRTPLAEAFIASMEEPADLAALDSVLDQIATFDVCQGQAVELRFFAGMDPREIAAVPGTTEATARVIGSSRRAGSDVNWSGYRECRQCL